jgi:ABC-type uncharacterized transport system ATPase subunit
MTLKPILSLENVHKDFGGVSAVNGVDLSLKPGELRALVGPNGCGKSTLFNLITGVLRPSLGRICLNGVDIAGLAPHRIARLGVGRKFQVPAVFGELTVAQNLDLGRAAADRWASNAPESYADVNLVERIHLANRTSLPAAVLSHGERQWLEIGMVLAARPRLLLLDEPTAGMTVSETATTVDLIRDVASAGNVTILVIEHDTGFLERLDCQVTVMAKGRVLISGPYGEIRGDADVRALYFGAGAA